MTDPRPIAILRAASGDDAVDVVRGLVHGLGDLSRVGLILGTASGSLAADRAFDCSRVDDGGKYISPAAFSRTLPSVIVAEITLALQMNGPSLLVSAPEASAALAIRRATLWMNAFDLLHCVAGGVEGGRAALLLLGREALRGALTLTATWQAAVHAREDLSLMRLSTWIRDGGDVELGAGVRISSAMDTSVIAGQ